MIVPTKEFTVRKHAHLQHGLVHLQLTTEEEDQRDGADAARCERLDAQAVGPDRGKPVQQRAEAQRGKEDRRFIEHRIGMLGRVALENERGHRNKHQRKHGDRYEQDSPIRQIDDDTGKRRADGGSEGDHQAEQAHRRAAALHGEHAHQNRHGHGHQDAGARSLQKAAAEQRNEGGGEAGKGATRSEDHHRNDEQGARGEFVDKPSSDRDHDGVDQGESRREPLSERGIDAHLAHNRRRGRRHYRLVEDGDERSGQQHHEHQLLPLRQTPFSHRVPFSGARLASPSPLMTYLGRAALQGRRPSNAPRAHRLAAHTSKTRKPSHMRRPPEKNERKKRGADGHP